MGRKKESVRGSEMVERNQHHASSYMRRKEPNCMSAFLNLFKRHVRWRIYFQSRHKPAQYSSTLEADLMLEIYCFRENRKRIVTIKSKNDSAYKSIIDSLKAH
jgi:hypothetical protein